MEKNDYIKKWVEGTLTEEELKVFEKTIEFEELKKLDQHLKYFKAPEYDIQKAYAEISEKRNEPTKTIKVEWFHQVLKVAAAVIILVIAGYAGLNWLSVMNIESGVAQKTEFYLPDSSKVILNAQSNAEYTAFQWRKKRSIKMRGEAFFAVAKGSKFDVLTEQGMVSVLGTKFNVISRKDYFEVVCFEGKVEVAYQDKLERLMPGRVIRVLKNKLEVSEKQVGAGPSWMKDESEFNSLPYWYVIREFERQYGKNIKVVGVDTNVLFTGGFVHNDLELALNSITLPLSIDYIINDNEIVLTRGKK